MSVALFPALDEQPLRAARSPSTDSFSIVVAIDEERRLSVQLDEFGDEPEELHPVENQPGAKRLCLGALCRYPGFFPFSGSHVSSTRRPSPACPTTDRVDQIQSRARSRWYQSGTGTRSFRATIP
jgi:hypothetical protein